MENIRVSRGISITVNDEGETIIMNVEDQNFIEKFYGLIDKLDNIALEMESKEVQEASEHNQLKLVIEHTKVIMADIDEMFGKESCRKIFGEIIPNPYLIADFFEQLKPIAEQYVDDRQKKIAQKYNNKRKGARTSKYRTKEEIIQDAMR